VRHRTLWRRVGPLAVAVILGSVALTSVATGASHRARSSSATKTIFVFAYYPHSLFTATWAWYNGWKQGAAKLGPGFKLVVKEEGSLDEDPGNFLSFIKTGMAEHPDGVIVQSNNSVALAPGLIQLQAQYPTVKFLAMDQPVPNWKDVAFVGTDNFAAGAQAGKWLLGAYQQHKFPSTQVAVFRAPPGAASQDERVAGFLAAIKKSPLKVVSTIESADATNSTALTNMADVLTGHPQLGAVFSATDDFGLGVAEELAKAHKLNVEDVSIDADSRAIADIISHTGMNAEVAQHFKYMGYEAVLTLGHAMEGQTVPKDVNTGTTLVTTGNAKAYLKEANLEGKPS
jgi:ribose transport system substrate-binding protein